MSAKRELAVADPRHGRLEGYSAGCREACCRAARARAERLRRHYFVRHGRIKRRPAAGTRRRLQALVALGWPARLLAAELGHTSAQAVHNLLATPRPEVLLATHEAVAQLYDRLSMTPGPSEMGRQRALAKGWAPPLAWDDDEIDNPASKPQGLQTAATSRLHAAVDEQLVQRALDGVRVYGANRAERLEVWRRWEQDGRSRAELDRRQHWNVARDLRRQAEDQAADEEPAA